MLRLAATLLGLTLITGPALAQERLMPIFASCDSIRITKSWIREQGEVPFSVNTGAVYVAQINEFVMGKFVVYVNPETYSMTATIDFEEDDMSCIVVIGDGFRPAYTE